MLRGRNVSSSVPGQSLHHAMDPIISPSQALHFCPINFCSRIILVSIQSNPGISSRKTRFLLYMPFQLPPFPLTTYLLPFKENFLKDVSIVTVSKSSSPILPSIHCNTAIIFPTSVTLLLARSSIFSAPNPMMGYPSSFLDVVTLIQTS